MAAACTAIARDGPPPMKLLFAACAVALSCCNAANAALVEPVEPVAAVTPGASASALTDSGFAPSAASAVLEAVRRNQVHEAPACRTDRADAIADGRIHVRPGETLCVRLQLDGDAVKAIELVDAAASGDALVISARLEDGRTFLTLVNPLRRWLRYHAWMQRRGTPGFRYTSSCPVLSNHRVGFEDWPFPIDELALGDFTLEPAGEESAPTRQMECR